MRSVFAAIGLVAALLASAAPAQQLAPRAPGLDGEAAERARVHALVGDLGLPELPPPEAGPRSSLFFADRLVPPGAGDGAADASLVTVTLNGNQTGTGKPEVLWYQLPDGYSASGPPHPMVIAWHGYGQSALSVSNLSTVDEECNARNWIYLSVTGIDDQLFGSPISQQSAQAGIQYMLDNFNVDEERLYMVGFSMGGGCVTSFASRHRDPAGLMIAAVGTVSMTGDWTETYALAPPAQKALMENPYNFGGPPSAFPFAYQRVSSLYFTPGSYPPAPGTLEAKIAMGDNLDTTPLWLSWDVADPIVENPPGMGAALAGLVTAAGGTAETHPVSGTPNPHSWAVLDETQLFDFFAGKSVVRWPLSFQAQLDDAGAVSFTQATQAVEGAFTWYAGTSVPATAALLLTGVENAARLTLAGGEASQADFPLHLTADSADALGYELELTGFTQPPGYLTLPLDGSLIEGVDSAPLTDSLLPDVPGFATLDANVQSEPWLGDLSSTPEPAVIGGPVQLLLDMPHGPDPTALLVLSLDEHLTHIKGGHVITADAFAPDLLALLPLALSPNGNVVLDASLPNDPVLHGLRVVMQALSFTAGGQVGNITNLWALHIE
jgi:predicted esterase